MVSHGVSLQNITQIYHKARALLAYYLSEGKLQRTNHCVPALTLFFSSSFDVGVFYLYIFLSPLDFYSNDIKSSRKSLRCLKDNISFQLRETW